MRASVLFVAFAFGCGPVQAVLSDPGPDDVFGAADDTGQLDDTGTLDDTGAQPPPPPEPDFSQWDGSRTFDFPDVLGEHCVDEVHEQGVEVGDNEDWFGAFEACSDCDYIYRVEVSPETICADATPGGQGFAVASPVGRGIERIGQTEIRVWTIRYSSWQGWSAEPLATGTLEGVVLSYAYEGDVYGASFTATGTVDFE